MAVAHLVALSFVSITAKYRYSFLEIQKIRMIDCINGNCDFMHVRILVCEGFVWKNNT